MIQLYRDLHILIYVTLWLTRLSLPHGAHHGPEKTYEMKHITRCNKSHTNCVAIATYTICDAISLTSQLDDMFLNYVIQGMCMLERTEEGRSKEDRKPVGKGVLLE